MIFDIPQWIVLENLFVHNIKIIVKHAINLFMNLNYYYNHSEFSDSSSSTINSENIA